MSRLDDLLDPLVEAAVTTTIPLRGDGADGLRERLRPALAEALRGSVKDQGGNVIDGERLTIEACRQTARDYLDRFLPNNPGQRDAILDWTADLIQAVREADQREHHIREGYSYASQRALDEAWAAQQRVAELEHVLRIVKRATRNVKVGRE